MWKSLVYVMFLLLIFQKGADIFLFLSINAFSKYPVAHFGHLFFLIIYFHSLVLRFISFCSYPSEPTTSLGAWRMSSFLVRSQLSLC